MRLLIGSRCQPSEYWHYLNLIDDWKYLILPRSIARENLFFTGENHLDDLWFGVSSRESVYALKIAPADKFEQNHESSVFAILIDPPRRNKDALKEMLLRARAAYVENRKISDESLKTILETYEYPTYSRAGELLSGLPDEWLDLPVEIELSVQLSENAGINQNIYDDHKCDSIQEVLEQIYSPRIDGFLLVYTVIVQDVTPFLFWDVDWPIARSGKTTPTLREKVSRGVPWEKESDQALFTIYQHLPWNSSSAPPYYGEPTIRLRVGGATNEKAVINWQKCAKALRKMRASR